MRDAILPVVLTVVMLLWLYVDARASKARTARVYASNFTRDELRRLGRDPDGTLNESCRKGSVPCAPDS